MNIHPEYPVYVWRRGEVDVETYTLPGEEELRIYVNSKLLVRLMASPTAREELSEMVRKLARMRVPVAVSLKAVTSLAVEFAAAWGIATVANLYGQQMTIYSHPERLGVG